MTEIRQAPTNAVRCSRCGGPSDRSPLRYCRACYNAYCRATRPKHSELRQIERKKANARSTANTYQKRGLIRPEPCSQCGEQSAEKHHEDYRKPLDVIWLCHQCHSRAHA